MWDDGSNMSLVQSWGYQHELGPELGISDRDLQSFLIIRIISNQITMTSDLRYYLGSCDHFPLQRDLELSSSSSLTSILGLNIGSFWVLAKISLVSTLEAFTLTEARLLWMSLDLIMVTLTSALTSASLVENRCHR